MKQRPWWSRFFSRARARLKAGEQEYGDKSHGRHTLDLIDEIQQELEDVAGWAAILHNRLDKLRAKAQSETERGREL